MLSGVDIGMSQGVRGNLTIAITALSIIIIVIKFFYEMLRESAEDEYRVVDEMDLEALDVRERNYRKRKANRPCSQ